MSHYTFQEIRPNIFLVMFDRQYDLNMHFLRFQEFYCSTSERFHKKSFKILEFMEWYAKEYGRGVFSYTTDWVGFNIDGEMIRKVVAAGIPDINHYDRTMLEIESRCNDLAKSKYCIIGTFKSRTAKSTIRHEVAHAYYYLIPEYKAQMDKLTNDLDPKFRQDLFENFRSLGYRENAYCDETQAYLSTGMPHYFPLPEGREKAFAKLYKEWDRKNKKG